MNIIEIEDYVKEELNSLKIKIENLNNIFKLKEKFKDLKINKTQGKDGILFTKFVNNLVDKVDIYSTCSCCADASILARPYVDIDGLSIYTEEIEFYIGRKNDCGTGIIRLDAWENNLKQHNISDKCISIIREYLDKNLPVDEEEDEEPY